MQKRVILMLVAALLFAPFAGCKSSNDGSWIGTGVGAGAGALVGGIIGHQSGNKWKGALIGAGVGALAGYIVGTELGAGSDDSAKSTPQYNDANQLFQQAGREDDPNRAIALYRQSIQADPSYPEAYNNMGLQYLKLGDRPMARNSFQDALRVEPQYQPAKDNLARMDLGMM